MCKIAISGNDKKVRLIFALVKGFEDNEIKVEMITNNAELKRNDTELKGINKTKHKIKKGRCATCEDYEKVSDRVLFGACKCLTSAYYGYMVNEKNTCKEYKKQLQRIKK